MGRILVLFEDDGVGDGRRVARAVADGAARSGATVRLRPLSSAAGRDIAWSRGILVDGGGSGPESPCAIKDWLDGLGIAGWRDLRDKPACVFAKRADTPSASLAARRLSARVLASRGVAVMEPHAAVDRGGEDPVASASAVGYWFGALRSRTMAARRRPRFPCSQSMRGD